MEDRGDVLYGEVLGVIPSFADDTDAVGRGKGGYRILAHSSRDLQQRTPDGVLDHYTFDFVATNRSKFIKLSSAQWALAKEAGWPEASSWLTELLR